MKLKLRLDEATPAGKVGLELVALRHQISAAERDGMPAHIIETLRQRERDLSSAVISTLAREGDLLSALVGRITVSERAAHIAPTGGTR